MSQRRWVMAMAVVALCLAMSVMLAASAARIGATKDSSEPTEAEPTEAEPTEAEPTESQRAGGDSGGPIDDAQVIAIRALADAATVGVVGTGCDGALRGSGFVVAGETYTNRHLVEAGIDVKLDQLLDPVVLAVSAKSSELDVAVAPGVGVVELEFAPGNASTGDVVFVAGHAGGGTTVVAQGRVHLYDDSGVYGPGGTVMLIDVETEPGFSGGPVLDRYGRVVAMLQGFEQAIGLTLAIPVEDLQAWNGSGRPATDGHCGQQDSSASGEETSR